ncbi:MAG TPA: hypothetical protein VHF05_01425 [Candidatus Paceibacterota bacterium]|jgi:hypothetical protein|nr:hypothetical protein [Candidatus Paceibacterota bacterium]
MEKKPIKTFQKNGKWVEHPGATRILECACGTKYIKTRPNQESCIKCMIKAAEK